jgi:serine/threonine protein kinase
MQIAFLDDDDRYQLQEPIDRGMLSTVYRGQDRVLRRMVAIKVLRETYSSTPTLVEQFQEEAKTVSGLQHPNIVQIYDYGQTRDKYYIVMELVQGANLRRYLRSRGVLAVDRAVIIAHDVALGLGAAHRRGIVHHNVSSSKILIGRDGSIKLTGFGLPSGIPQSNSPEQLQGEVGNSTTDVYSLGTVIYEMLTGRTPFDADTPVAIAMQHIQDLPTRPGIFNPNIPSSLEGIIMRCLEKKPEKRFQDGTQLARALEHL